MTRSKKDGRPANFRPQISQESQLASLKVDCPSCGKPAGQKCDKGGYAGRHPGSHLDRVRRAARTATEGAK